MERIRQYFIAALMALVLFFGGATASAAPQWEQIYMHVDEMIAQSVATYASGDVQGAKQIVNDAYYGVYEKDGLEKAIRSTIAAKNANLTEYQFSRLKKAMIEGKSQEEVQATADKLMAMIDDDVQTLEGKGVSGGRWASFWPAFLILLREGIEAMLVLVAIMAYLAKSGNGKYLSTVYNWAIGGIVASFATAYVFSELMGEFGAGANQEIIEGATALIAVAVLLSASFWLGSKAKAAEWKKYIEGLMKTTLTTGRARALGIASFLAVYREGAEVILFYQALFNSAAGDIEMIWLGFGLGCITIGILFFLVRFGLVSIPLRPFFIVTSVLMFAMAVVFTGGGVSGLQEGGLISQTVIETVDIPSIDWLGLYPTVETCGAQIAMLLFGTVMYVWQKMKA